MRCACKSGSNLTRGDGGQGRVAAAEPLQPPAAQTQAERLGSRPCRASAAAEWSRVPGGAGLGVVGVLPLTHSARLEEAAHCLTGWRAAAMPMRPRGHGRGEQA